MECFQGRGVECLLQALLMLVWLQLPCSRTALLRIAIA